MILFCEIYRSGHFNLLFRVLILSPLFEIKIVVEIIMYSVIICNSCYLVNLLELSPML